MLRLFNVFAMLIRVRATERFGSDDLGDIRFFGFLSELAERLIHHNLTRKAILLIRHKVRLHIPAIIVLQTTFLLRFLLFLFLLFGLRQAQIKDAHSHEKEEQSSSR